MAGARARRGAVAVVGLVVTVFCILSLATVEMARRAERAVEHTQTVIGEAHALLGGMQELESAGRGYVISGEKAYLDAYRARRGIVGERLRQLQRLTADNPRQSSRLARMDELLRAKLAFTDNSVEARAQGHPHPPIDSTLMGELRQVGQSFEDEEANLLHTRRKALNQRYNLILVCGAVFALIATGAPAFGLRKYVDIEGRAATAAMEEQMRLAIESAPAAIAMFDRQMRYVAASRRFARDYRLTIPFEHLAGRSHYEIFPECPDRWREIHRRCLDGAVERCAEDRFPRADGQVDWVSWEIRPWRDAGGAVRGIVLCSENITWRKRMEEALAESEHKFHLLADAIPQLAWIADAEGFIHWYNRRWYEYTGTTREQMTGWGWQAVHDKEVLPAVMERWLTSIATGETFDMTFPLRGADGRFRPFLTRVQPVRDGEGKVQHWFGTNTEISELKAMEESLREAKGEAERANEAKSHFLAAASHDLRQPFQALRLYLDFLTQQLQEPQHLKAASMASTALSAGENLLNGLLNISKLESGTVPIERHPVAFADLAAELASQWEEVARAKGLDFILVPSSLVFDSDPLLLSRLLRNLLDNAIKYTDQGRILVGCRRGRDGARIEVWDTGIGIDAEQGQRVFDDFYQVGNPSRDQAMGLGIGLAVVRRIAGLLGHRIALRSWPGRGSVFTLTLGLAASPGEARNPATATSGEMAARAPR